MKTKIVVNIAFNAWGFRECRLQKEWIDYRMDIFMKYTCKSLINQTNQSFTAMIVYDKSTEDLIYDALSKYPKLQENIIFTATPNKLLANLIESYDYLYLVRIDSDDMYHPSFIQQLVDYHNDGETECIINQGGYVYDPANNFLGEWYYESPPFYTLIYKVENYLKGFRYKIIGGHEGIINLKHDILNLKNYMVIIHGKNTLNEFESPNFKGIIRSENDKNSILGEFKL